MPDTATSTAREVIATLLAPLTTKNCRPLAEETGHRASYRIQRLLSRACMNETSLAGALRGYVIGHLDTHDVALVVDETGDIKKGRHTVGVAHQYTGMTSQVENRQVAVHLAYTTLVAHTLINHRPRHLQGSVGAGRSLLDLSHTRAHQVLSKT